jgi:predicted O-methyltransferase YrrM
MKRIASLVMVVAAFCAIALAQRESGAATAVAGKTEAEKKILAVLDDMARERRTYLSVPPEDGKVLRILTEAVGAKSVVEIGTSTGYSGLWFTLALANTGGHLTTFEIDRKRAEQARANFKEAGVDAMVTVVVGDAHQEVPKVKSPVDVVFIDADKEGYVDYLNKLLPKVRPGGLILGHNTRMVPEYVKAVTSSADLETIFYNEGGGLIVTLKKR